MNKIVSGLLAATLSVSFAAAAAMPAEAESLYVPLGPALSSDVQNVDYQPWMKHRGNWQGTAGQWQNQARNGGGTYWNGHRGYHDYHPGYHQHGDYWFPLAAFATGALITGAIINNNQNRVYRGDSHVQWCYDRYRSYRAYDNTFQPYNGPRQQCYSPY